MIRSSFKHRVVLSMVLVTLGGLGATSPAYAAKESLQSIIDRVEHNNDCKVLSVQEMEHGDRRIYVIKMLTKDGRVKVVQVRASD